MSSMTGPSVEPRILKRPRKREVAFLVFGAAVFALGVSAVSTICVICAHPATVAAVG
ncbi:hypothetical protein [Leucobacter sp. GX24907]